MRLTPATLGPAVEFGAVATNGARDGSSSSRAAGRVKETCVFRSPTVVLARASEYMHAMPPSFALLSQIRRTWAGLSSAVRQAR